MKELLHGTLKVRPNGKKFKDSHYHKKEFDPKWWDNMIKHVKSDKYPESPKFKRNPGFRTFCKEFFGSAMYLTYNEMSINMYNKLIYFKNKGYIMMALEDNFVVVAQVASSTIEED